jgi:hypothetical protein
MEWLAVSMLTWVEDCVQIFEAATDAGAEDIQPSKDEEHGFMGFKVKLACWCTNQGRKDEIWPKFCRNFQDFFGRNWVEDDH